MTKFRGVKILVFSKSAFILVGNLGELLGVITSFLADLSAEAVSAATLMDGMSGLNSSVDCRFISWRDIGLGSSFTVPSLMSFSKSIPALRSRKVLT